MIPTYDIKKFLALARVLSGKISTGLKVRIIGPNCFKKVERMIILMGKNKKHTFDEVTSGNIVAMVGLDDVISKSATLIDAKNENYHVIKDMRLPVPPLLPINIKAQEEIAMKLLEGLTLLSKLDPMIVCNVDEKATSSISGVTEPHLDRCKNYLQDDLLGGAKITSTSPIVTFCESVLDRSDCTVMKMSRNKSICLYMVARPLDKFLAKAIDDGRIGPHVDPEFCSNILNNEFGWDRELANKIWCFGPNSTGPNILVNMCNGVVKHLDDIKGLVIEGFQKATLAGPLAGENMRNIRFELRDAKIAKDFLSRGPKQIIDAAQHVVYAAYLSAHPCLMEPIYLVEIKAIERDLCLIYQTVYNKRGHVFKEEKMSDSPFYNLQAYLPVMESLGFFTDFQARNSDIIFPLVVFDHWDIRNLDPQKSDNEVGSLVLQTRIRKKLGDMKKLSYYEN
ncbi:Ribosomal protein S5/Elongation factor G/III/V family protein [Striga hermonthica]|uniref:Ribosomal protein S5/Elongation factor G/III/V family protein n=1 Tax=Striga hermonthica TaxID=68872 RepID=A0A9N7NCU8_STRHE|nr:Ribosomal protein S5/Elongation factor G/III/V family protein [Striga hermonthica]